MWDQFQSDLRYGIRTLRKSPAFSAAAIISLALGIGVNALTFSVLDSLILRPLPIDHPEQVMTVETAGGVSHSFPNYREFRDNNSTFTGLAGYRIAPMSLESGGNPSRIWGYLATGNYFDLLGVKPALGRFFHQQDDLHVGASPFAVLSYSLWQSRFAGDPSIAGKEIRINGLSYSVLGVAPRGFHGTELFYWPEIWVPMMMQPQIEARASWLDERSTWDTWIFGRIKPGVTPARATTDLNRIANDLARHYPDSDQGLRIKLSKPGLVGSFRNMVEAFTAGLLLLAGLVLLTACANLAGLTLARATDRQREMAIRSSLGAGRGRVIRQLLTESSLLAILGGAAGCALVLVLSRLISQWHAPIEFPVQFEINPDWRVFTFAALISLATGLLFGLGPALQLSRVEVSGVLKGDIGEGILRRRFRLATRDLLVAAEIALCFVLVFGSIVSLRGLQNALTMPLGFNPEGVTIAGVELGLAGYSPARGKAFQERAAEALRNLPGVVSAAYANSLPLSIDQSNTTVQASDQPLKQGRNKQSASYYDISPGLLSTLRIPLIEGRDFDRHDNEHSRQVAIVNQAFARKILRTDHPLAMTFRYGLGGPLVEVIGLVADGKYVSLTEERRLAVFRCTYQDYNSTTTLVVRSRLPSSVVVDQIHRQIAALDPLLPVYGAGSLTGMLGFALFPMHAAAVALSAFGILAMVLATTGIHGLVAYAVARRTREVGIRMALGAKPRQVLILVLGKFTLLFVAGVMLGSVLALAAGRALSAIVYTTSPIDPALLVLVLFVLLVAAMFSSWMPSRRAVRTDPMSALRYE